MADELVPLGDTGWLLWPDSVLRGAGFPTEYVRRLADPRLQDDVSAYDEALPRSYAALERLAGDPLFREAITWQNPDVVSNFLRGICDGRGHLTGKKGRKRALTIASYAQRYSTKNDTIGFFGPVGWARWTGGPKAINLAVGKALTRRRTVYFEAWAIDTVARALATEAGLTPWMQPRLMACHLLIGRTVHHPYGARTELSDAQAALLARCDGSRRVRDLGPNALQQLTALAEAGIVHLGFEGPIETWPERSLRLKLLEVDDLERRTRALSTLDELIAFRDAVQDSAGDPDELLNAMRRLQEAFERVTGQGATRRPGQSYAGRTLIYEDAVRGASVQLGQPIIEAIAAPLDLLLTSARWLVGRVAEQYQQLLLGLFEACRARTGATSVPLSTLLALATPYFVQRSRSPEPLANAVRELQAKWARVLSVPDGVTRHSVRSDEIRHSVNREFPPVGEPWAAAVHYSPDLLLAGASLDRINEGDFTVILGEVHLAVNTMESRPMVEQHADPARLLALSEADHGGRRIYSVPTKMWPQVNSRTYPSALLSPTYTYWCLHKEDTGAPGPIMPAAGLDVVHDGGRLKVQSRVDCAEFDLLEVLGEQLTAVVANAFTPATMGPHIPRLAIDRVVFQREMWKHEAPDLYWAHERSEAARYRHARAWQAAQALPLRCYYRTACERKPMFVDFSSPPLVELFARAVRRIPSAEPQTVTISEMLPDLDDTWLTDAAANTYTAELRIIVVDPKLRQKGRSCRGQS